MKRTLIGWMCGWMLVVSVMGAEGSRAERCKLDVYRPDGVE
ncbi:MAG: hypothetical protein RI897_4267, partial [Verrucomicrobiota bacterium]